MRLPAGLVRWNGFYCRADPQRTKGDGRIRIGISLTSRHDTEARTGARWMIERARAAADAGLDSLTVGDHHVGRVPYYQNTPILGRLLAEWDQRPAGCLFLLPLWHPVLAAEQIGTLAALASGPFIVQTGVGGGEATFAAMGADLRSRGVDLDEALRVVGELLAGRTVTSERFGLVDAVIAPVPPEPVTWWMGAEADRALDRVARHGAVWYAPPGLDLDGAAERLDAFRSRCADHAAPVRAVVRRDVLVADDDAAARHRADEVLAAGYRGLDADRILAGAPDRVAASLADFAELGFDEVVTRTITVTQPEALRSIELLGEVRRRLRTSA